MTKKKCECNYDCECNLDECCCDKKNKIIKIGALIGGVSLLGGIVATLLLKNKKDNE